MPDQGSSFWHAIVDALTESVVVRDSSGTVMFVNAAAAGFAGIQTRDGIGSELGSRVDQYVKEDESPVTLADLPAARVLATGMPVREEVFGIQTIDRGLRWVTVSAASVNIRGDDAAPGVVTTALDVTDRVIAERALRTSEERFRSAVGSMPDGLSPAMVTTRCSAPRWAPGAPAL